MTEVGKEQAAGRRKAGHKATSGDGCAASRNQNEQERV